MHNLQKKFFSINYALSHVCVSKCVTFHTLVLCLGTYKKEKERTVLTSQFVQSY